MLRPGRFDRRVVLDDGPDVQVGVATDRDLGGHVAPRGDEDAVGDGVEPSDLGAGMHHRRRGGAEGSEPTIDLRAHRAVADGDDPPGGLDGCGLDTSTLHHLQILGSGPHCQPDPGVAEEEHEYRHTNNRHDESNQRLRGYGYLAHLQGDGRQ